MHPVLGEQPYDRSIGTIVRKEGRMDATQIADRVRSRRKHLRLSQEELARLAGVSPRLIGQIEGGKGTVRLDKLADLLDALGLELRIESRTTS